jgi:hypothetical protein
VGREGLKRKSFLPPGGKKIEAESPVFGAPAPKRRKNSKAEWNYKWVLGKAQWEWNGKKNREGG